MPNALCPYCRNIHNMHASITERCVTRSDGKKTLIRTRSYHCDECRGCVYCEDDLGRILSLDHNR